MPERYRLTLRPYTYAVVPDVPHRLVEGGPYGAIETEEPLAPEDICQFDLHHEPEEFLTFTEGQRRICRGYGVLEWSPSWRARVVIPRQPERTPPGTEFDCRPEQWARLLPDTPVNREAYRERYRIPD